MVRDRKSAEGQQGDGRKQGGRVKPYRSDTQRARVIAAARIGEPLREVAVKEDIPERTVQQWVHDAKLKAAAEGRDPLLVDGEYRIAFMAQTLTEGALNSLAESGEPLHKYLVPLNIVRGTAVDKVLKARDGDAPTHLTQVLIIRESPPALAPPDVVDALEGEVVE